MLGPSAGALSRIFGGTTGAAGAAAQAMTKRKKMPFGMPQRRAGAMNPGLGTFNRAKPPMAKTPPTGMSKIALPSEGQITAPGGSGGAINRRKLPGTIGTY